MALQISRKGKLYLKKEASYADPTVTFASTDAVRHIDCGFTYDPTGRVTNLEKQQSPAAITLFNRRVTAGFDLRSALLRPSGTLNTLPEADEIFEAAFGARTNVTLTTTVSSGGSTTGATVASAGTLAAGDAVLLTRNSVRYVRILTSVAGAVLTWAPALPTAMANGEAVKGCITYKITDTLTLTLAALHLLPNFKRMLLGFPIDKFTMRFDANNEPMISASGPAQRQLTTGLPSDPVAFTTVGGNPPSGLVGELLVGDIPYLFKRADIEMSNGMRLRNVEYGNDGLASEAYRPSRTGITWNLDAFVDQEATLYDLTEVGTYTSLFKQTGRTEGNIIACYAPKVEFKVPDTTDGDEEADWAFRGRCLDTADGLNDGLKLVLA